MLERKALKGLMSNCDIPAISYAVIKQGSFLADGFGATNCGFYKLNKFDSQAVHKFDSSRYILTQDALYYFDVSSSRLEELKTEIFQRKNIELWISQDPNFQKYNEIPALKQEQLSQLKDLFGLNSFRAEEVSKTTQFGAASLSKPVFAYLVLKIIENKDIQKVLKLENFSLETKLADFIPHFADNNPLANQMTIGMALSHQSGVFDPAQSNGAPEIIFKPGSEFGYANFPLFYLQVALEKATGQTLEALAKEYIFKSCTMNNSSFLKIGFTDQLIKDGNIFPLQPDSFSSVAVFSLRTTAEDYANFMISWMNDAKLAKYLTLPVVSLGKDWWASQLVDKKVLNNLAWGYGVGQQLDQNGNVNLIFHNGDMNQWRAIFAIDPINKTGAIYFSNSHNGDVLAQQVMQNIINTNPALTYMRDKLGFAISAEPDWEAKQFDRFKAVDLIMAKKRVDAATINLNVVRKKMRSDENPVCSTAWTEAILQATERLYQAKESLNHLKQMSSFPDKKIDPVIATSNAQLEIIQNTKNMHLSEPTLGTSNKNNPEMDANRISKSPFYISKGPRFGK